MSAPLLLAIDAGTGSCRSVLFDADGHQLAVCQREWDHHELPDAPGSQVFDTERNWTLICATLTEALDRAGISGQGVTAVTATSMREGMVLFDAAGRELWACPNVDSRGGEEAAELVRSGAAEDIYRQAGDWVAITAPARFRWIARHEPEVFAQIARVGMLGAWVLTKLSGCFATDASLGSSSGMFDLAERRWSSEIVELCGLDPVVFPRVEEPGTVVGEVTAAAAVETGLRQGTPVVAGGADTQLALLGIGVAQPGRCTVVGGSFWQHTALLDEPLIDPEARLRTLCHAVPGQWMIEGIGFWSGLVMRWFRDGFCEAEKELAQANGADVYALLERRAAEVPPGSHGVLALFSNLMAASRWVHGPPAFMQFDVCNPERSGKRECVRAIEEGAAYVSRGHLEIIAEVTGIEIDEVLFTGGAAKGELWPQILADVLGVPVRLPVVKESTALGAALLAGVGAGVYRDAMEAAALVSRFGRDVEPDPEAHAAYQRLYGEWREVYARAKAISDDGLLRPLWRAAGA